MTRCPDCGQYTCACLSIETVDKYTLDSVRAVTNAVLPEFDYPTEPDESTPPPQEREETDTDYDPIGSAELINPEDYYLERYKGHYHRG